MIRNLIGSVRRAIGDRRRYRTALAEIQALSERDLVDMRGDRATMVATLREQVFG